MLIKDFIPAIEKSEIQDILIRTNEDKSYDFIFYGDVKDCPKNLLDKVVKEIFTCSMLAHIKPKYEIVIYKKDRNTMDL